MTPVDDAAPGARRARVIVVMGVAGCGKTAIGSLLAQRMGCRFIEGDSLHPPENVARMASGRPLTDELRVGWLDRIGSEMSSSVGRGESVVAACSALKRIYRDQLRGHEPGVVFVYPEVDPETASRRVGSRKGHFMPASLVESQFAILEPPQSDERAVMLNGSRAIDELVDEARREIASLTRDRA